MIEQRLKEIRNSVGLSQKDFGAIMGIAQTSYANYENGRSSIPASLLEALSLKLNLNLNWLITGEGNMYLDNALGDNDETDILRAPSEDEERIYRETLEKGQKYKIEIETNTVLIPMTNMKLSAGKGWDWESEEIYTGELLPVPMKIARRFDEKNLIAATVKGDSMEPTLHDGEPVAYVKEFENGDGIYALAILDEVYIKRLSIDKLKKEITIISDNPKYPAKTYPMDQEGLQVLGKVVFWLHVE